MYIHCSLRLIEIKKVVQCVSHFYPVLKSKIQSGVYKFLFFFKHILVLKLAVFDMT